MADTGVAPGRAPDRPPDPAGLRSRRLRWLILPWRLDVGDDEQVVVRGARQSDADALALMHGRCSPETMEARYGPGSMRMPRASLRRLVTAELALVVVSGHAAWSASRI